MAIMPNIPPVLVPSDALARVKRDIEHKRERYRVIQAILSALAPFDGKQCTKRIEPVVQAALPEYRLSYRPADKVWGSFKLVLWNDGPGGGWTARENTEAMPIPYNSRLELTVARREEPGLVTGSDSKIDVERIRSDWGISYVLDGERADKLESELKGLPTAIAQYNAAHQKFSAALAGLSPFGYMLFPSR